MTNPWPTIATPPVASSVEEGSHTPRGRRPVASLGREDDGLAWSLLPEDTTALVRQLCAIATTMGFVAGPDMRRPPTTQPMVEVVMAIDARTIATAAAYIAACTRLHRAAPGPRGTEDDLSQLVSRAEHFARAVVQNELDGIDVNRDGLVEVLDPRRLTVDGDGFVAVQRSAPGRGLR